MPTLVLLGARCSGKSAVADYLVSAEGFQRVRIASAAGRVDDEPGNANGVEGECLYFDTSAEFLDYATLNWRKKFVTTGIRNRKELDGFVKRPWVLLVGCEAALGWRWKQRNQVARRAGLQEVTLEQFVYDDDLEMFGNNDASTSKAVTNLPGSPETPVKKKKSSIQTLHIPHGDTASTLNLPTIPPPSPDLARRTLSSLNLSDGESNGGRMPTPITQLLRMCNLHIQTSGFEHLDALHDHLREIELTKEDRMRPGWDRYFMTLAGLASLRSNCMKRRVGAVLVSNKRVISTGYNGTPRGMRNCNEGGCARCNSTSILNGQVTGATTPIKSGMGLDQCLCLHAEENALLEAGRDRVEGGVIYCNTCPCLLCAVKICQTGVKEVCYSQAYSMDDMSASIFKEAGVLMRQIDLD